MSGGKTITITIPKGTKFRYLRMTGFSRHPSVFEVNPYAGDTALDRKLWHASNLFSAFDKMHFKKALSAKINIREAVPGSYLCITVNGRPGREGAYVAMKVAGTDNYIGAPDRAPAYPTNPWESRAATTVFGTTSYIQVTKDMLNKDIEVYVLTHDGVKLKSDVWITCHTPPYAEKTLMLK
jgi:hypothetical protein